MLGTRREFLLNGLRIGALVPILPSLASAHGTSSRDDERALVVLQLGGGNDGLNTVVPLRQDAYWRMRPTLGLARGALHRLDDEHGLHPAMGALAETYRAGHLAVVQGVGSPNPDRSHFRALEMWHTADPFGPAGEEGWLGKLSGQVAARQPQATPAFAIGNGPLPLSMRSRERLPPTLADPRGLRVHERAADFAPWRTKLLQGGASGELEFLRRAAGSTYETAARMAAIVERDESSQYPPHELAQRLRLVASLIAGEFGTRIFHLSLDGFDTHSRQGPVHESLLRQLSESLAAFQDDLGRRGVAQRVLVLVFSEFGRRAAENGSKGTDHGSGAPVFLMGASVRAGLHGSAPDLENLIEGDVPATTDFRALYTTLEARWMGLTPSTSIAPMDLIAD